MRTAELTVLTALALAGPLAAQQPEHGRAHQPDSARRAGAQPGQMPHRAPGAGPRMAMQGGMAHQLHLLVGADWLAARLDSAGVVIVHVGRTDSAYRAAHIPGARFLPLSAVATAVGGIPNQFPPPDRLAATFRDLGVGDAARIVLYGDDPGIFAARAWVALDLLGHGNRAALLDGGLSRWRAGGRATETTVRTPAPQSFAAAWRADRVVDAKWVRAHLGDSTVLLVDARPPDQFGGAEPPCAPGQAACSEIPAERRGHIAGATNLFWMDGLESREDPVLRPMHDLHHGLFERAGANRPLVRTIVTYCRTGMQSSHAYFVARHIGYPDVRMYDGSFIEWAALAPGSYPVERSAR